MTTGILAATAALALAASAPAHAAFTPGGSFTLTGVLLVTRPPSPVVYSCNTQLTLDATATQVTSVAISGSSLCSFLTAYNLPWPITSFPALGNNPASVTISNVTIAYIQAGVLCGPGTLSGVWDNASPGTWRTYQTIMDTHCLFRPSQFTASPAQTVIVP